MRTNVTFADLVAIARRVGVTVAEAPSSHRGKLGSMGTVRGLTCHHTGTPNSYRPELEYPDFNVVKEGRPGLENSLSAWGLGRYTTIYVFSEFLSWHAGTWSWQGITDGNGDFLGIEAAGVGDWTPFQRAVYPRLVASALLFLGETNARAWAPRHLDGAVPRGRKSDAAHFEQEFLPGKDFYQSVEWLIANPAYININYGGGGFLMALSEAQQDTLARQVSYIYDRMTPGTSGVKHHGVGFEALIEGSLTSGKAGEWKASWGYNTLSTVLALVKELASRSGVSVDQKALAESLRPMLAQIVQEALAADNGAEADEIVDRFVARLAS